MQRELTSFDIHILVSELQDLIGGYVEKIYQPDRDELLIKVKNTSTGIKQQLFCKNEHMFCRIEHNISTPTTPSTFAMTLRKYLQNGKISEISQHEFDRIIKLGIHRKEGIYVLMFELFKNGNIILLNPDNSIILPLFRQEWAHRIIKSRQPYQPPPSQINPFTLSSGQFNKILLASQKDLVRTLAVQLNMGGVYAEELCLLTKLEKNIPIKQVNEEKLEQLYTSFSEFLSRFQNQTFAPIHIIENDAPVDVFPFPMKHYENKTSQPVSSFNAGLAALINKQQQEEEKPKTQQEKRIEKFQRQLAQQIKSINKFKEIIPAKKKEGDLLYLHYTICETILTTINHMLKEKNKTEHIQHINNDIHVHEFNPVKNILTIRVLDQQNNPVQINLDFRKTVAENAKIKYEESKKYQDKLNGAKKAVENTKQSLEKLQNQHKLQHIQEPRAQTQTKQYWFEQYRWTLSSERNVIIAGKDAKTNDRIVKKYLVDGDRYIHADIHGAASCIVKNKDINQNIIPISDNTLEEACIFACCYSKAWKQYGGAQAYWVLPEQVSKTPQSGEFVPKGAFIIRGKRNYFRCPMELAIGLITIEDDKKIISGAKTALETLSQHYVVIQPGTLKKSEAIQKLSKLFQVSADEIMHILPPGDIQIVFSKGVKQ